MRIFHSLGKVPRSDCWALRLLSMTVSVVGLRSLDWTSKVPISNPGMLSFLQAGKESPFLARWQRNPNEMSAAWRPLDSVSRPVSVDF